jgi:hypothetical protein
MQALRTRRHCGSRLSTIDGATRYVFAMQMAGGTPGDLKAYIMTGGAGMADDRFLPQQTRPCC